MEPSVRNAADVEAAPETEKPQSEARPIITPPLKPEDVFVPKNTPGEPAALQSAMNELSRRRGHRSIWKKMFGMR